MSAPNKTDDGAQLSSSQTPLARLMTLVWFAGFGAVTAATWMGLLVARHGQPAPEAVQYAFVLIWLVVTLVLAVRCGRLKRVRVEGFYLYVSDFRREQRIALDDIAAVGPDDSRSHQGVKVTLRRPCAFGDEIVFIPRKVWAFWRPHPVVAELRRRAGLSQTSRH